MLRLLPLLLLMVAGWLEAAEPSPAGFQRIDSHVHVMPPPPEFLELLERLDVRLVNVTLIDPHVPGFNTPEPQTTGAAEIARQSRSRIAWDSALDPAGFEQPDYAERTNRHLLSTFDRGAVGVKIYKAVGMDLQDKSGRYVMPDDPAFAPVYEFIARHNRTLVAHLAEPRSCWQPLDPADPHYGYYKNNPDWHMFRHPERPSYETILAARDRVLAAHPKLRVVGCHLGSMEYDVDEIARRLDRYPNFAVDTAARTPNLMLQPREKVRRFFIRYQDRVLWGTDSMVLQWDAAGAALKNWEAAYAREWRYFATDETFEWNGRKIQGLALPPKVL
ncbi:MAG: amidohydrolase family protein, partial [Acidobacteria bacterium]|nr:amidohydrolase family protein [Acidobacteriota bacterium]